MSYRRLLNYLRYRIRIYNHNYNVLMNMVKNNNTKLQKYKNINTKIKTDFYRERNIYKKINFINQKIQLIQNEIELNKPEKNIALLIGLNYFESEESRLNGCHNDVDNIKNKLVENGFETQNIKILKDSEDKKVKITRSIVLNELNKLTNLTKGKVFIHFSGHGMSLTDYNKDEIDKCDESLYLNDNTYITDDEIFNILKKFNSNVKVRCIFDCCHSGTIGDLRYNYDISENKNNITGKVSNNDIIIISGCIDSSYSYDCFNLNNRKKYSGACTSSFLKYFNKDSSISYLVRDMINNLNSLHIPQQPQVSSSKELNFESKFL